MKQGAFYSQVSVGALAVNNYNQPGSASMAESQGKAAYLWLTTFPNTWIESTKTKPSAPGIDQTLNVVGQLNSAEKREGTSVAGSSNNEMPSGTHSSSGLKLKPLNTLVQKEFNNQSQPNLLPKPSIAPTPSKTCTAKKIFAGKDGKIIGHQVSNAGAAPPPGKVAIPNLASENQAGATGTHQKIKIVKSADGKIQVHTSLFTCIHE